MASGGWGLRHQTHAKPSHWEILATPLFRLDQAFIRIYLSFAKMAFLMELPLSRAWKLTGQIWKYSGKPESEDLFILFFRD